MFRAHAGESAPDVFARPGTRGAPPKENLCLGDSFSCDQHPEVGAPRVASREPRCCLTGRQSIAPAGVVMKHDIPDFNGFG